MMPWNAIQPPIAMTITCNSSAPSNSLNNSKCNNSEPSSKHNNRLYSGVNNSKRSRGKVLHIRNKGSVRCSSDRTWPSTSNSPRDGVRKRKSSTNRGGKRAVRCYRMRRVGDGDRDHTLK